MTSKTFSPENVEPIDPPRGTRTVRRARGKIIPTGYVYFVLATRSGLVKIGYARHPWARFNSLQVGSPEPLAMMGVVATYLPLELERDLHAHFAADRVRGSGFGSRTS
jgi:hypothetical protein